MLAIQKNETLPFDFGDQRLNRRGSWFANLLVRKAHTTIHRLSSEWKEQLACYRFMKNAKVTSVDIISGLTQEMLPRIVPHTHYLILQDTTQPNFEWNRTQIKAQSGLGLIGDHRSLGFYLHPSLVLRAQDEQCIGFSSIKTYIHEPEAPLKAGKHKQLPIEEKESYRWLESVQDSSAFFAESNTRTTIQDREGDIYELFATLPTAQDHLLVRSRDDRNVVNQAGKQAKLYASLQERAFEGQYALQVRGDIRQHRQARVALMQVRWVAVELQPPARLKKRYASRKVWAVEAQEAAHTLPEGEAPIHWRLVTTHPVAHFEAACQMLYWYSLRWYIETLFRVLKTQGFGVEATQLEDGQALIKMTLFALWAALRVMALLLAAKSISPENQPIQDLFSPQQTACLEAILPKLEGQTAKLKNPYPAATLRWAYWIMARLGGWKGYASQRPPGIITLSEGLKQFELIYFGFSAKT
jgi:hypothetical protein